MPITLSSSACTGRSMSTGLRTCYRSWRTWLIRRRGWGGAATSAGRSATAASRRSSCAWRWCITVVIGRNIPLDDFVDWLAQFGAEGILEFVGREDPMVERLFRNRRDQVCDYSTATAGAVIERYFGAGTHETLAAGTRTLYHCRPNTT